MSRGAEQTLLITFIENGQKNVSGGKNTWKMLVAM